MRLILLPFCACIAMSTGPRRAPADTPNTSTALPATSRKPDSGSPVRPGMGRYYIKASVVHLAPLVDSGELVLSNLSGYSRVAVKPGPVAGTGADVEATTIPALILGFSVPGFDGRVSIETILGTPVTLDLRATGTLASESLAPYALGNLPTGIPALGSTLGTVKALPPMVTAVYRFLPQWPVQPYAGAGLNYMHIYDARLTNPVLSEVGNPRMKVDDALGLVAQAGVDARIVGRYFATLDIKMIAGLQMEAHVYDIYVRTPRLPIFEAPHVGDATIEMTVLPLIVSAGLGARF